MHNDPPFGLALIDAARLLRARFDRALADAHLGLTPGEARTLVYVGLHPGSRQTVLAALMGVEPMTLVGYLDRLEACGLIVREPDSSDRRAKIIHLTPQAEPLRIRVIEVLGGTREAVMEEFHPDEVAVFKDLLLRLRTRLLADERSPEAPASEPP